MGLRGPGAKPVKRIESFDEEVEPTPRDWEDASLSRSERLFAFIEGLKLTAGAHAGKPLSLRDWQRDDLSKVYATDDDGRRIVNQALITEARKNGKTQLAAALALAHLAGPESEPRGEVYSAASDRNQAARVFREMEAMILADVDLSGRCNIQRFAKRIEVINGPGTGSVYEALSSDARKAHSLSPSFVVCDELAQWQNRDLFDNLVTGTGARDQPLVVIISTQSSNPNHVMSELVAYGRSINDGTITDPTFVAIIRAVPDDADPWDESLWHLANPALGDFRSIEEMRGFAAKAKRIPAREAVFRNLYLNQAIAADTRFIAAADWKACGGTFDLDELRGRPCWGGLDLSSTTDLTALVLYFPLDGGVVIPHFFIPGADLREREARDRVPYRIWRDQGLIETTNGRAIDKRAVALRLAEISGMFEIRGIGFDRWRAKDLQRLLDDEGIDLPLIEFGQGFKEMGPALDALETVVLDGKLRHAAHPVLAWNCSNAVIDIDPAGNRKLSKARAIARIDGMTALAMAIGLHARGDEQLPFDFGDIQVIAI